MNDAINIDTNDYPDDERIEDLDFGEWSDIAPGLRVRMVDDVLETEARDLRALAAPHPSREERTVTSDIPRLHASRTFALR